MALLEDERNVLRWLTEYGPLRKTQIRKMLCCESDRAADKIIRNLQRGYFIDEIGNGEYLGTDKYCVPDQKMLQAVWVMLRFIHQIDPTEHFAADIPAQLFFLKDNLAYEIIVLYEGEEHLLKLIQPQPEMKYIIVVPQMAMAEQLPLPDAPCLLAIVQPSGEEEPQITFYS